MSMYSEILVEASKRDRRDGRQTARPGELLARLIECRQRLGPRVAASGHGSVLDLAANVDYDLALVELCRERGIPAEPAAFEHPLAERHRLERELAAMGVEVRDFDSPSLEGAEDLAVGAHEGRFSPAARASARGGD